MCDSNAHRRWQVGNDIHSDNVRKHYVVKDAGIGRIEYAIYQVAIVQAVCNVLCAQRAWDGAAVYIPRHGVPAAFVCKRGIKCIDAARTNRIVSYCDGRARSQVVMKNRDDV